MYSVFYVVFSAADVVELFVDMLVCIVFLMLCCLLLTYRYLLNMLVCIVFFMLCFLLLT